MSAALLTRGQVFGLQNLLTCLLVTLGYFTEVNFLPRNFIYPYTTGPIILPILHSIPITLAR